jgi:hypothetical protein
MASSEQRRFTFFKAVGVYIDHSLHEALLLLEKARSYEKIVGSSNSYYGYSSSDGNAKCNLEKLVLYLQEASVTPLSVDNVGRRLAIIDRLEESVVWSRKLKCLRKIGFAEVNGHAYSAKYLQVADEYAAKGYSMLCNEWLLVADLFKATVHAPWLPKSAFSALDGKDESTGRLDACRMILSLLSSFPELLTRDPESVVARYKCKLSVTEKEQKHSKELQQVQALCAEQTDPRLRRLLQYQCTVLTGAIAELRSMYEQCVSETETYKTLLSQARCLQALWTGVAGMQAAFQASNLEPASHIKRNVAALAPQYQTLCTEGEKLLGDLSAFFATQALHPSSSFASDTSTLQKRAEAITASVKELAKGISGNALAPHVRVKIREALNASPFTKYHMKIVECLEKAASASTPRDSDRFVQLAEGIFASAVTCHTLWERAVERRDDKLADFWQRARERAWEVGCAIFSNAYYSSEGVPEVVGAVHLAQWAETVQLQRKASPLHQAETDVALLRCELLLASGRNYFYDNNRNFLGKLYQTMEIVHRLLSGYNLIQARGGGFDVVSAEALATPNVEETLLWAAQMVGYLHSLRGQQYFMPDSARSAFGCLSALPALLYKANRARDVSQLRFAADLSLWSLQLRGAGDHLGSWVLDALISTYPTQSFPDNASDAVRAFRVQLSAALENALLDECPGKRLRVADQWPPQRRAWLSGATELVLPAAQAAAVSEIVQTALHGLHWQRISCKEKSPEMQNHAVKISKKALEVVIYQQMWTEAVVESTDTEENPTEFLLRATKLLQRALELQYQAIQSGKLQVSAQCTQLCDFLKPIHSRGLKLFARQDNSREDEPVDVEKARQAVEAMCWRGELELRAIAAELGGRSKVAAKWAVAARECAHAVFSGDCDMDDRLRYDWEEIRQRAETLAELARRAEESVAAVAKAAVSAQPKPAPAQRKGGGPAARGGTGRAGAQG